MQNNEVCIYNKSAIDAFRRSDYVTDWINNLPPEYKSSPVFSDGEFAAIFGYQLGINIVEHSGIDLSNDTDTLGAISMRIIPPGKNLMVEKSFSDYFDQFFMHKNKIGVLEICIGDRGNGIYHTLKDTYIDTINKLGLSFEPSPDDVISLAFDKFGSRKKQHEKWGGSHALNRILKCIEKYEGIIKIRSSGRELIYDSFISNGYSIGNKSGIRLGLYPSKHNINSVSHPFGVQLQILLPLSSPSKPLSRGSFNVQSKTFNKSHYTLGRVIPVDSFFQSYCDLLEDKSLKDNLITLSNNLMLEPSNKIIVFDFAGRDWSEEELAYFIYSQNIVLNSYLCIGIDLSGVNAKSIAKREFLSSAVFAENYSFQNDIGMDFFCGLSSKHKLFPIMDSEGYVWWYGIGQYKDLSTIFDALLNISSSIDLPKLLEQNKFNDEIMLDRIILYLKSNYQLFVSKDDRFWKCLISPSIFSEANTKAVRGVITNEISRLGCVKTNDRLYKLPSSDKYTEKFIQTTPMLQNDIIVSQLAEWMSISIKNMLPDSALDSSGASEILLLCMTAPAELLSRNISNKLNNIWTYIVNLGYYSAVDDEDLFDPNLFQMPAIVIADIVDRERTIDKIYTFAAEKNIELLGLIGIIKFVPNSEVDTNDISVVKNIKLQQKMSSSKIFYNKEEFFIANMKRPKSYSEEEARRLKGDDKLVFIEPYSLHDFPYTSLRETISTTNKRTKANSERLEMLDTIGALREGHFVFGRHHFKIATSLKTIFSHDTVSGLICSEIMNIARSSDIDHVLLPLHSNIGDLIGRLKFAGHFYLKKNIEYTFCILTKVLTEKPFYLLPNNIKEIIQNRAISMVRTSLDGIKLLIVDDAMASGRSIETLLRAIIRTSRKFYNHFTLHKSPVKSIDVYVVINRQGRAKNTLWGGIRNIALQGDGEWEAWKGDPSIHFNFHRWVDLSMPVRDKDSCDICREYSLIKSIEANIHFPDKFSIHNELVQRIEEIKARPINTKSFIQKKHSRLPLCIAIGRFEVDTYELALLEYYNLLHRGHPYISLINCFSEILEKYIEIKNQKRSGEIKNLEKLLIEIGRILFLKWDAICSQWVERHLINKLSGNIAKISRLLKDILPYAGIALANSHDIEKSRNISDYFIAVLKEIATLKESTDPDAENRLNLIVGCMSYYIYFKYICEKINKNDDIAKHIGLNDKALLDKIEENILIDGIDNKSKTMLTTFYNFIQTIGIPDDDFMHHLYFILNHTLRAARHYHPQLIPSSISMVLSDKKVSKADIVFLIDNLIMFIHSLKKVESMMPTLFVNNRVLNSIRALEHLVKIVNKNMQTSKLYQLNDEIEYHLQQIINYYPNNRSNALFERLCEINIAIKPILGWLETECNKSNIEIQTYCDCYDLKDLTIIAPHKDNIKYIIENYTIREFENIDNKKCPKPKIAIEIQKDEEGDYKLPKMNLIIYTNFILIDKKGFSSEIGPGAREGYGEYNRLFQLKIDIREGYSENDAVMQYISDARFKLIVSGCIGYNLIKEGEDE